MELLQIVPGDGIGMPAWPGRVTVLDVWPSDDGSHARVFWRSLEYGDGVTWLSEAALVRRHWDFRSQSTAKTYQPEPSLVLAAVTAMTKAQRQAGIGAAADGWEG